MSSLHLYNALVKKVLFLCLFIDEETETGEFRGVPWGSHG